MQLSDLSIRKAMREERIVFNPIVEDHQIQPSSVDLRLGSSFHYLRGSGKLITSAIQVRPKGFMLACTRERVTLPSDISGQVRGKSSVGRTGLMVECAGLLDPGFSGQITLELFNMTDEYIRLESDTLICQVLFFQMDGPAARPYGHPELRSRYQGQRGATAAREVRGGRG